MWDISTITKIIWFCITSVKRDYTLTTSYDFSGGKERNLLLVLRLIFLLMIYLQDEIHRHFDMDCGSKDSKGNKLKEKLMLHKLEPPTLNALQELFSLVHDRVNIADHCVSVDSTATTSSADREKCVKSFCSLVSIISQERKRL